MFWQDDIPRELGWLARAEGWAELPSGGHVEREEVAEVPRPVAAPGWWRLQVRGPLAALGRARRRVVGEAR
jgi:hypothetical protein